MKTSIFRPFYLSMALVLVFFTACDKENEKTEIPYVYVNFIIYPNTLDFIPEGGYVYVT